MMLFAMRSGRAVSAPPRLTRWEILGAWLHVWTPPKGLDVPPVPRRKVAIWGAAVALVIAVAAALVIPPLNEAKRDGAAARARQEAATVAAERARLRVDQKIHTLQVTPAHRVPVEQALVAALERGITADAKTRAKRGTIKGPVLGTKCEVAGSAVVQFPDSRVYKCFVQTATGIPGEGGDVLGTGYPFVATIYAKAGKVTWCKENPQPDEKGRRLLGVPISPVCAGKLSQVL
jgi:type II secretory pathway pseudopilin PulG